MKNITISQMTTVCGGSFWGGLACGASIGMAVLAPNPGTIVLAVGTCGWALE
jgi:4-amino-4-deoxy-L-arabinose transferase-like glycosyltransferase